MPDGQGRFYGLLSRVWALLYLKKESNHLHYPVTFSYEQSMSYERQILGRPSLVVYVLFMG